MRPSRSSGRRTTRAFRPRIPRRDRLRELVRLAAEYAHAYAAMRRRGVRPAHPAALAEVLRVNEAAGRHMSMARLTAKLTEANREAEIQALIPTREEAFVLADLSVDQLMGYRRMVAEDEETLSQHNLFGYWAWRRGDPPGTMGHGQATLFQEAIDRRLALLDAYRAELDQLHPEADRPETHVTPQTSDGP